LKLIWFLAPLPWLLAAQNLDSDRTLVIVNSESALSALDLRSPDLARAVRLEIREASKPAPLPGYRLASGVPTPYRPRDLGWSLLQAVLAAEGKP
jgi:hypothetical protein